MAMTVHVYNLHGHRVRRFGDLAAAKRWADDKARRQYFSTWCDRTGERCERKGGEWRQLTPPDLGDYAPRDGEPAEQWWQR